VNMSQYPTKTSAWWAAKPLRDAVENQVSIGTPAPTIKKLVERGLWLESLTLAAKSKVHILGTISILRDFAMLRGDVPTQRNRWKRKW
jgi:hypothetical protein